MVNVHHHITLSRLWIWPQLFPSGTTLPRLSWTERRGPTGSWWRTPSMTTTASSRSPLPRSVSPDHEKMLINSCWHDETKYFYPGQLFLCLWHHVWRSHSIIECVLAGRRNEKHASSANTFLWSLTYPPLTRSTVPVNVPKVTFSVTASKVVIWGESCRSMYAVWNLWD